MPIPHINISISHFLVSIQSTLDFVGTKAHIPNIATSSETNKGIKLATPLACANNPAAKGINAAPIDPTINPHSAAVSYQKQQ